VEYDEVMSRLEALADPRTVEGMARFGINPAGTFGVSVKELRKLAKDAGKDHGLALALWVSGVHEARILASMVDVPGWLARCRRRNGSRPSIRGTSVTRIPLSSQTRKELWKQRWFRPAVENQCGIRVRRRGTTAGSAG